MIWVWIMSMLLAAGRLFGPADLSPTAPADDGEPTVINSRTPGPVDEVLLEEAREDGDAPRRAVTVREPIGLTDGPPRDSGFGVVGTGADEQSADAAPLFSLRQLFDAMRQQESGGLPNRGRDAVGDDGHALGPYQIWEPYWQDAAESDTELGGSYDDVRDAAYAERVMLAYWRRYCPRALADPTRLEHLEILARTHNGGPRGASKTATLDYWDKIKRRLQRSPM